MPSDQLYNDPGLVEFYDIENGWTADSEYLKTMAAGRASILDLGCGTGMLTAALAEKGKRVVGVDPAAAMLHVARQRPGGDRVRWAEGDGRTIRLGETFDMVLLSGHAFQVFLTREDQLAALKTIAAHLSPDGRFIFDSRNPLVEEWREWTPAGSERDIVHPVLGQVLAWNDVQHDPTTGVVEYGTFYRVAADGRAYTGRSKIAFPSHEELVTMVDEAGLVVETWLGGWDGRPFEASEPEIIPIGRLR
ncbi:class I SAM-dependent methyltransferase [Ensifer adhaerens]|uniref:class I SAM-dependent methyltransferase n=1 Tax=Ensifer adhaerens TaxID=106592 RepID=UPI001CBF547A|nr:class I SAM-dependent methyltransferase [Ensifer adhaerens]MBZ7924067.1 class I SAM-dependent methyltransferase [Ensifer adhaerens]UAX92594.1 class I SAM-dependent methyltransferase [Ensifer adhaerens]UAY00230.1 class I SAM-dependent methyltransferase [Ensifer adhaerens]UAY07612.1 class I SAM-dependent methyltransferase [Ensifer adhaerens]